MAYFEAHCDSNCIGCEKNRSGWCIWKDIAVRGLGYTRNFSGNLTSSDKM